MPEQQHSPKFIWLIVLAGASFANVAQSTAQIRTWTDSSESYSIKGELVLVHEVSGELQAEVVQPDRKRMAIPVSKLSRRDRNIALDFHRRWVNGDLIVEALSNRSRKARPAAIISSKPKRDLRTIDAPAKAPSVWNSDTLPTKSEPRLSDHAQPPAVSQASASEEDSDLETAIVLDHTVNRDSSGRSQQNPVYNVDVDTDAFSLLPRSVAKIVSLLHDENTKVDVKRRSIAELQALWPESNQPVLIDVMINCLSHEDSDVRIGALNLLAQHDSQNSLKYILARIDDVSFELRSRTCEVLAELKDARVIPELAKRLDTADCRRIATVLKVFGPDANQFIHPWLADEELSDANLLEICKLLSITGDSSSIEPLENLKQRKSGLMLRQVDYAIGQIQKRESSAN